MAYEVLISNAPVGAKLPDASSQNIIDLLRDRISIVPIPGSNDGPFVFQAGTPGAADRGKLWFRKTDDTSAGILLGAYFYLNGLWCKSYKVMPGSMMFFNGDPTDAFDPDTYYGNFESDTPEVAGDWYGWRLLLTGAHGLGFPGKLLMAASKWDDTANQYTALQPDSTYANSGGDTTGTTLTPANIPSLAGTVNESPAVYDAGTDHSGTFRDLIGDKWNTGASAPSTPATAKFTNPNTGEVATPIPYKPPPFKVSALAVFVGYTYTDASAQTS